MSVISIMVPDEVVVIDREIVSNVSMAGIPPNYHNIQWYETEGWIEYVWNPLDDGPKTPNTPITDLAPFMTQITYAQECITLRENPQFYYATQDAVFSGDIEYGFGVAIPVEVPDWIPPANSTPLVPPTPESFQELYWSGTEWVLSAFPIGLTLPAAQANLITQIQTNGAEAVNYQARIYSTLQLLTETNPGDLLTADYPSMTLDEYQTYINGQVSAKIAEVEAATTVAQLYPYNPEVNPTP